MPPEAHPVPLNSLDDFPAGEGLGVPRGPAKKAAVSATAKVSNPTVRKGLEGAGKKAAKAGAHLRKHHKAYGFGVTGAAAWDIIDKD